MTTTATTVPHGAGTTDEPVLAERTRPWRGRILLLLGLMLMAVSLRHAVTGVSPLLGRIEQDIALGAVGTTVLGMLPTIAFGLAGFLAPPLIRRLGPARVAVLAMGLGTVGTVVRVLGDSSYQFLAFGFLALFALGMGNVAGPPLVKRYFPDRMATAMSVLTLMTQAGATIPAFLAVPTANALGWRLSVASYAGLMLLAALPWVMASVQDRSRTGGAAAASGSRPASAPKVGLKQLATNPISRGAAIFYGMAALNTYAMLAWLPTIIAAQGASEARAATMYSVFTFLTLPMALVTPVLASKMQRPLLLGLLFPAALAVGYLGLVLHPETDLLWAIVTGVSGGAFPFAMVMFNRRTRTTDGSATVTGFGLGVGYALGTVGPFLGGLLSTLTGGWTVPLLVLAATTLLMVHGARLLTSETVFEDHTSTAAVPTTH